MEWINTKDKLPDDSRFVLVGAFRHSKTEFDYFLGYIKEGVWKARTDEEFVTVEAGWNGGVIMSNVDQADVTHWCELPKPPQENKTTNSEKANKKNSST